MNDGLVAASCPGCAGAGHRVFQVRDLNHGVLREPVNLQRCGSCGLGWITPRPQTEALLEAYPEGAPPTGSHPTDDPIRIQRIRRFQTGGRLLDVGCGGGGFLVAALGGGFEAEGIEFDPRRVARVREDRGLSVRCDRFPEMDTRPGTFDVVTLWHVIEHLPDPTAALCCARDLLRPGGMLALATPNLDSVQRHVFRGAWYHLDAPRHLVLFTARGLRHLLERAGFAPALTCWGSREHDWAGIRYTVEHNLLPGAAWWQRAIRRAVRGTAAPVAALEARLGVGATFEIYARRI